MTTHVRTLIRGALAATVLAAVASASPAAAQQDSRRPVLAVTAGATQYDLSGTGTEAFFGVRAQVPFGRILLLEPAISTFSYASQGVGPDLRVVLPEAQLQAQIPLGRARPYLGAGAGLGLQRIGGQSWTALTLSAASGVRLDLPSGFVVGGELRVRAVDPWGGVTADWGLSIGRRL